MCSPHQRRSSRPLSSWASASTAREASCWSTAATSPGLVHLAPGLRSGGAWAAQTHETPRDIALSQSDHLCFRLQVLIYSSRAQPRRASLTGLTMISIMLRSSAPLRSSSSPPSGRAGTLNGATCSPLGSEAHTPPLIEGWCVNTVGGREHWWSVRYACYGFIRGWSTGPEGD